MARCLVDVIASNLLLWARRAIAIVEDYDDEKYIVGLDFTGLSRRSLGVQCDCTRFEDGQPCKHVWVVIKKIDTEYEILQHPIGQLTLNEIDVTTLDVGDERQKRKTAKAKTTRQRQPTQVTKAAIAAELLDRHAHRARQAQRAPQTQRATTAALIIDNVKSRSSKTESPEVAGWKQSLHRLATASAASSLAPPCSVPSGVFGDVMTQQQHWFLLSLARPENQKGLHVEVLRSTRKADGQWSKPTPCYFGPRDLSEVTDEHERAVLLIMKPELNMASTYGYGYSYNRSTESGAVQCASSACSAIAEATPGDWPVCMEAGRWPSFRGCEASSTRRHGRRALAVITHGCTEPG